MEIISGLVIIFFACIIIWKACDGFEDASGFLGRNMKGGVKGATIDAIGSSMPELFTTFFFLVLTGDAAGFASGIGTTSGSAVFNIMIIPAAVIMSVIVINRKVQYINVNPKVILRDGIALMLAILCLIIFVSEKTLEWYHGVFLMSLYVVYVISLFFIKMDSEGDDDDEYEYEAGSGGRIKALLKLDLSHAILGNNVMNSTRAWILLILSTSIVGGSCHLLVTGCEMLGDGLNWNTYVVALIFAAAATSVPDTIISVKSANNGAYNDAISNALGSNIFDICFALGMPLTIYTLVYDKSIVMTGGNDEMNFIGQFRVLLLFLTLFATMIFYYGAKRKKLGAKSGYLLILLYVLFIAYTLAYTYDASFIDGLSQFLIDINDFLVNLSPFHK
ncbi:sodium:calcium antiporter [Flammeovirga sp. EKP202]|uniref:sodium:calcium antiporter n=1 Tax=Flammeovirga sp. EKP202 TaxID=2770592 RepID=UPI00165EF3A5|nr:sodium:calcium antiporter [Flammeovirga sp. EKP202]MBD0402131.1 sodium:calcium antiporter [Flammeovirga sp. EKP202]